MARGVSRSTHAIVSCVSPLRCCTERVIQGDTQRWRWGRIATTAAIPNRVNLPSLRCAGQLGPSRVPAVRAAPSVPAASLTPSRACNAPAAKGRAARAPAMPSRAPSEAGPRDARRRSTAIYPSHAQGSTAGAVAQGAQGVVLKIGGNCSCWRAKVAHLSGHFLLDVQRHVHGWTDSATIM